MDNCLKDIITILLLGKNALSLSKWLLNVTKDFYFKEMLSINQSIMFQEEYYTDKNISTLILIRNDYWSASLHIIMISEGSCDTEDWSNFFK